MVMTGRFSLPETHAAFLRWQEITGLGEASAEWGEVWAVLGDAGLLEADRCPQRSLFDDPATALGETLGARQLRLAVLGGATLWTQCNPPEFIGLPLPPYTGLTDLPTCTAAVAALLETLYSELAEDDIELGLTRLALELPRRQLRYMTSPSEALAHQLDLAIATQQPDLLQDEVISLTLAAARSDDTFARKTFTRLAQHIGLALTPLVDGGWLMYRSTLDS